MAEIPSNPTLWGENASREASEARFRQLFEDADAMSIQGYLPDGTVVYWNRASEAIYGYTEDEALGANLLDLIIPAEMRLEVEGAVRWMFESGQGIPPMRLNLIHKDGHTVPVYSSHTVVSVPDQTPVLFCMDADMSALGRAEAELRIAATAFETQQGVLITDAHGVILKVNQAFCRATGYSVSEAIGQTQSLINSDRHPPDFYEAIWRGAVDHGTWQGEVWHKRKNGEVYADLVTIAAVKDDKGNVTHYVIAQTDVTERKEAEAKIKHLAYYDPLTNLPNRLMLLDRLQQAVAASCRKMSSGAVLLIDLDHFKTLNVTLGHDFGDLLIQQVAKRLTACTRKNDSAARLGGDEFVMMLEDLSQNLLEAATQVEAVGVKLLASLSEIYNLREHEYVGSVSIGVTLFSAATSSVDDLMKQADLAMYGAKLAGRNALRFFDPQMQSAVTLRAELVSGLRKGLREQQFQLHYQPQVDGSGRVSGAEALVRWERPGQGRVSPADFIPIAEESGLILPLGNWVLETACSQLADWSRRQESALLTLAVNVSAYQFRRPDFVAQVLEILNKTGAEPQRLKLELTESLMVDDVEGVIAKMVALKTKGVGLSLDDFGTGYSSLSYLKRLPLDQLKIDQSFVRHILTDANDAAIARMVVALGESLGLAVIAEGVESEAQRDFLARHGCHAYQGYLYSRPLPLEDFEIFVKQALNTLEGGQV